MQCVEPSWLRAAEDHPRAFFHAPSDLIESDHLRKREFFQSIEDPELGTLEAPGSPFIAPEMPWRNGRAPRLGEHNVDVFEGLLGLERSELITLYAVGAI